MILGHAFTASWLEHVAFCTTHTMHLRLALMYHVVARQKMKKSKIPKLEQVHVNT
jgi:hypothetical protein